MIQSTRGKKTWAQHGDSTVHSTHTRLRRCSWLSGKEAALGCVYDLRWEDITPWGEILEGYRMALSKVKLGGHIPGFPTLAVLLSRCGIAKTNPNQSNSSNWRSARSEYRMWAPDFYSPLTHTNSLPASLNGLGSHLDSSTSVFGRAFPTDAISTSRGKTIKQISIGAVAQRQEPYKVESPQPMDESTFLSVPTAKSLDHDSMPKGKPMP